MSLGLKRGIVQLEPHDKQWDEAAIQTIKILKSILGDDAIDIQHIGSTAIPAIKAKPIIDIVVGVTDFDKVMLHNEQLRQVGIFYRGSDVERQLLYVMGDMENDTRTHHIHIVKWNGTEWKNYWLSRIRSIISCFPLVYATLSSAYLLSSSSFTLSYCKAIFSLAFRQSLK